VGVPQDADHVLRVVDLDTTWAAQVVAFCEQQAPLNRLEDGQAAAAMRSDLLFDLGCLRYAIGAPLKDVGTCLRESAVAALSVFEQDGSLRTEGGEPDRSLANPVRGREGMQRALVAGDRALASKLAAAVQGDAGELAPARAVGDALRAGRAAAFLDALADLLLAHRLHAERPEYRHRPERLLSIPALAYSVQALDRGLVSRDSLPPDDVFLPLGLLPVSAG
jgi:hypothetical protein